MAGRISLIQFISFSLYNKDCLLFEPDSAVTPHETAARNYDMYPQATDLFMATIADVADYYESMIQSRTV